MKNHKSYLYAQSVVDHKINAPKYVILQCEEFLRMANDENPMYIIDEDKVELIDNLLQLLNMAKGLNSGDTVYNCISGFQSFFIVAILCTVHRSNIDRRRYETAILEICRKNGKTWLIGIIFILLFLLEPQFSKFYTSSMELEIRSLAKEVKLRYDKRKGILGYRQMCTQLNRKLKKKYNKKRYYRIMCALGLKAVIRRKRASYVKAAEIHVVENVMNRNFNANSPNLKWCTDVTELKYGNGHKSYLSAIIDVYDNSIVSWVLSHSNNNKLVMDTLKRAYAKNPGVSPLLQSDRGFQYTSHEYNRLHVKYGFKKSMSRVSRCLDNQPIERFWGTYKSESYYLTKHDTYKDVLSEVSKYIHYYNNYRYTERLEGLSPNEYRRAA